MHACWIEEEDQVARSGAQRELELIMGIEGRAAPRRLSFGLVELSSSRVRESEREQDKNYTVSHRRCRAFSDKMLNRQRQKVEMATC